jgi:prolyl-tRNA editing enzyme YbaK/EbsC (Cys-tRNA(Pro) deacylase)
VTVLPTVGSLVTRPALEAPDLLAPPVAAFLGSWQVGADVAVAEIDPALADTAALVAAHGVPADASANCVVVAGRRGGDERTAACVVLATTRADVNGAVRRLLAVRKASFLPAERAVTETGMEYGGITPLGLGVRRSKLVLPGGLLAELPGAEVVEGLAVDAPATP